MYIFIHIHLYIYTTQDASHDGKILRGNVGATPLAPFGLHHPPIRFQRRPAGANTYCLPSEAGGRASCMQN